MNPYILLLQILHPNSLSFSFLCSSLRLLFLFLLQLLLSLDGSLLLLMLSLHLLSLPITNHLVDHSYFMLLSFYYSLQVVIAALTAQFSRILSVSLQINENTSPCSWYTISPFTSSANSSKPYWWTIRSLIFCSNAFLFLYAVSFGKYTCFFTLASSSAFSLSSKIRWRMLLCTTWDSFSGSSTTTTGSFFTSTAWSNSSNLVRSSLQISSKSYYS